MGGHMPRRKAYTSVVRIDETDKSRSQGKSDVLFRGFQCLNPACEAMVVAEDSLVGADGFQVGCPACGHLVTDGDKTTLYKARVTYPETGETGDTVAFAIDHTGHARNGIPL